jgi:hypothetical protein
MEGEGLQEIWKEKSLRAVTVSESELGSNVGDHPVCAYDALP